MAAPVIMPRQGQSVESCIFSEWFVPVGQKVQKGDLLFSYETDKAAFEAEAPEDGTLLAVFAESGDAIPVLQTIAVIGKPGEDIDPYRPGTDQGADSIQVRDEKTTLETSEDPESGQINVSDTKYPAGLSSVNDPTGSSAQGPGQKVVKTSKDTTTELKISPRAKKAAEKHHVNYTTLAGSGPEGRIIERDILRKAGDIPKATPLARAISYEDHIDLPLTGSGKHGKILADDVIKANIPSADGDYEDKKISNIRRIIAENMYASLRNTAQLTLHASADARKIKSLRNYFKKESAEGNKPNVTINDLVCFSTVKALHAHPGMNAHFLVDSIRYFRKVHLGFAVDTARGLMVPTLMNADQMNLERFAIRMKELASQAQSARIDPELLTGATFTVTNLGAFGIEMFTPVLNPPQIGILGLNTITMYPSQLEDGSFGFIPRIGLSLTFDHRAIDGAPAAAFLKDVVKEIENMEI